MAFNTRKDRRLTMRQTLWIKNYIETGNATEAAARTYSCRSRSVAGAIGSENLQKLAYPKLMEEMGLTDVALINVGTKGMLEANKSMLDGSVVPDYGVRHKYWETMLRLKHKLGPESVTNQQFNTGGDMTIEFLGEDQIKH